jgi:hypothetical protein
MGLGGTDGSELRFAGSVEGLASVIGQDRVGPLRDFLQRADAPGYTVGYG